MSRLRRASLWIELISSVLRKAIYISGLRLGILVISLLVASTITAGPLEAAAVLDFRVGEWDDRTRFVIETDEPINVFQGAKPDSALSYLTLHFDGVGPDALFAGLKTKLADHPLVSDYDFSGRQLSSHLTLQLAEPAYVRTFELARDAGQPYRAVIDIFPRSKSVAKLVDVRVGLENNRERLVLETDRPIPFHLQTNPTGKSFRIELQNVESESVTRAINTAIQNDGAALDVVKGNGKNRGRKVFTQLRIKLKRAVKFQAFNLHPEGRYDHRLVIDFVPLTPEKTTEPEAQTSIRQKGNKPLDAKLPSSYPTEMWLDVRVNRQSQSTTVVALQDRHGAILVSGRDLNSWGIRTPVSGAITHFGEAYYSLGDLGITAQVDTAQLTASLEVPPALFDREILTAGRDSSPQLTHSSLGGFVNYDVVTTYNDASKNASGSGLFEIGAFNGWGSGTTSATAREQQGGNGTYELIRLDTTWRKDDPAGMHTLVIGDTSTHGPAWGGGARFGGLQWGTNFSLRPGFLTIPLVAMSGEATLPSTIDLYVNDALKFREEIPPGPFTIEDIPTVTGSGETRLVVRDILGREQVITQSFYASNQLLRQGLNQYSVEIGAIREDYGLRSNQYGRPIAAGTWRSGITDQLTLESHIQALGKERHEEQYMAGLGLVWQAPFGGVFSSAWAASAGNGKQRDGALVSAGYQYQGDSFGAGFEAEQVTEHFSRIGLSRKSARPEQRLSGYLGTGFDRLGSLSLGYTEQTFWNREPVKFGTANYTLSLGRFGQFALSAIHFFDDNSTALQAAYTVPLTMERTSAGAVVSKTETDTSGSLRLQRSPPFGSGFGYYLSADAGNNERYQGSLSYQNDVGQWQVEAANARGVNFVRANARGGLAWMDSGVYASRSLQSSFGVVRLEGFEDVRIYADNQQIAQTDENGYALVPYLRPYERNTIRLEQADIPMSVTLSDVDMQVSPFYRSGVFIDFPIVQSRNALMTIVDGGGRPLPVGAVVHTRSGSMFPVGYQGEAYLTNLKDQNYLRATWEKQECHFNLYTPDSTEPYIDVGTVECTKP